MNSSEKVSPRQRAVRIRIGDSAIMAAVVSLVYGLCVIASPRVFPEILAAQFERGVLTTGIGLLALALNLGWYWRIAKRRQASLNALTVIALVVLSLFFTVCFSVLVNNSMLKAVAGIEHTYQQVTEEVLVYTYMALVASIFLPYLVLRLTQDYIPKTD